MNGMCYILEGQSAKNGLACIFQATGNILLQQGQSQHDLAQVTEHKGSSKKNRSNMESDLFFPGTPPPKKVFTFLENANQQSFITLQKLTIVHQHFKINV